MLNFQVLRIREVLDLEETLHLTDTFGGQVHYLVLFIDNKVTGFLSFDTHNGIHFGQIFHILTANHLTCQNITGFIQLRGFTALSGNNQRCSCFINQDRVNFIDDCVMQISKHQLLLIDHHVITQIIETKFVVGNIGNVAVVCGSSLFRLHVVQNHTNRQSKKFMYLAHHLSITLCQIVIDSYYMNSFSFQSVQISRRGTYKRFTFTGFHLSDTSLVQNNSTHQLNAEMLHIQYTFCSFTHSSKSFRQ